MPHPLHLSLAPPTTKVKKKQFCVSIWPRCTENMQKFDFKGMYWTVVFVYHHIPKHYQLSDLHSIRLFCSGVPVSTTRRRVLMEFMALETADASFFRMWPSSQMTKSGPVHQNISQFSTFPLSKCVWWSQAVLPQLLTNTFTMVCQLFMLAG